MSATTETHPPMRVVDLSIARAGRPRSERVVDGATFTVESAATLALMGPTGSGKSSLAKILAGMTDAGLAVVGGDAWVEGISVRRPGRRHRVLTYVAGYLPQSAGAALPARQTVSDVIGDPITSRDRNVNQRALAVRVASLLDEMMLPLGAANKYPYELSAGMRQRVAVARSLVLQPRVFIADEPFANLDIEVREAVREAILRRRSEYGMSTLLVTNETETAAQLDAHVLVLRGGHTIAYGPSTDDLLWTPGSDADRRLIST